jgi:hypothetical protein
MTLETLTLTLVVVVKGYASNITLTASARLNIYFIMTLAILSK